LCEPYKKNHHHLKTKPISRTYPYVYAVGYSYFRLSVIPSQPVPTLMRRRPLVAQDGDVPVSSRHSASTSPPPSRRGRDATDDEEDELDDGSNKRSRSSEEPARRKRKRRTASEGSGKKTNLSHFDEAQRTIARASIPHRKMQVLCIHAFPDADAEREHVVAAWTRGANQVRVSPPPALSSGGFNFVSARTQYRNSRSRFPTACAI
jgi:hypothetical protein